MANPLAVPRFLLPRGLHTFRQSQSHLLPIARASPRTLPAAPSLCRHASSKSSGCSKPIVLEKPAKFNPPSHPQRLRKQVPRSYGPEITERERDTMKKKQYPHMMPPEGSFMHWFMTNRTVHVWISLSVLTTLAVVTLVNEFRRTSPYAHLLPSFDNFLSHPFSSLGQATEVYKLHTNARSEEAAEKRKNRIEEARKRKKYRVAHGLEEVSQGLQMEGEGPVGVDGALRAQEGEGFVDFEGNRRPVKKWLGIW